MRTWAVLWVIVLALPVAVELLTLLDWDISTPPLTRVIVHYIPEPLFWTLWAFAVVWTFLHFRSVYRRRANDPGGAASRLWETARPVAVRRRKPGSSVLLIRLPNPLFDALVEEANRRGKGPAALLREILEKALADNSGAGG